MKATVQMGGLTREARMALFRVDKYLEIGGASSTSAVTITKQEYEALRAVVLSESVRSEGDDPVIRATLVGPDERFEIALNVKHPKCHAAADAFWAYWKENGETHKHGYYESTWGAINAALRLVGVRTHNYSASALSPARVAEGDTICKSCRGSGTVRGMTYGHGPDDYETDVECPDCKGTGESPAKEQPGDVASMVNQLRMHAGATDTHIPRPMLARAADLLAKLGPKAQVMHDLHDALGVKWGDDPYAEIARLKRIERLYAYPPPPPPERP